MSLTAAFRRTAIAATVAIAATLGIGATPALAGAGCSADCIGSIGANQYLQTNAAVYVNVQTTVPANVRAQLIAANGTVLTTVGDLAGSYTAAHTMNTAYLMQQGVTYKLKVTATDKQGRSFSETRSLRALQRTVNVSVNSVTVSEDSDYGTGEIMAEIKLGPGFTTLFTRRPITATKTFPLYFNADFPTVPSSTKFQVELEDDDNDGGVFTYCGPRTPFSTGSNDCFDWTTGSSTISFSQTKGVTEGSFSVSGSGPIKFTVSGTYEAIVA